MPHPHFTPLTAVIVGTLAWFTAAPAVRIADANEHTGANSSQAVADPPSLAEPDDIISRSSCARFMIPPETAPGVHVDATVVADQRLGNVLIPGFTVPGFDIPEQPIPTGADDLFSGHSAHLGSTASSLLRRVARNLRRRIPNAAACVDGHTDSTGTPEANAALSLRQAATVRRWLIAHGGIPTERIEAFGLGDTLPASSNRTRSGRAYNRRVVIGAIAP